MAKVDTSVIGTKYNKGPTAEFGEGPCGRAESFKKDLGHTGHQGTWYPCQLQIRRMAGRFSVNLKFYVGNSAQCRRVFLQR